MNKNILAIGIGTLVEWSEFTFYAYLIYKFSLLFFPNLDVRFSILSGFGTFAVSYLARPLGGVIFGHIGDKIGRQKALSISIFLMGIVTLLIGLLPTYNSIGVIAPLLLVILRFLQGIAVAGEYTGAAVFLIEHSQGNKPYLISSWVCTSAGAGMLLGAIAAMIVTLPNMPAWSYRVPFFLGSVACFLSFYIRYKLTETVDYLHLSKSKKLERVPIKAILKNYKTSLLKTASIAALVGIYIYICNIWWITYVIEHHYFTNLEGRILATLGQACVVILTPVMAYLGERWDGQKVMKIGFSLAVFVAPLIFYLTPTRNFYLLALCHIFYGICNAAVTSTMFKYLTDLFPTAIRYTGLAVGWNLSVAVLGGTAPIVAQYFSSIGFITIPIYYVALSALLALFLNWKTLPQSLQTRAVSIAS